MRVTMRHSVTNMPDTLTHTDAQTHTMHHARVYSSTSIVGINRSLVQTIMYSRCLADSLPPPCVLDFPASASADDGPYLLFVAQKGGPMLSSTSLRNADYAAARGVWVRGWPVLDRTPHMLDPHIA